MFPLPVPGSRLQGLRDRAPLRHPDVTPPHRAGNRPSCMLCRMRKAGAGVGLGVGQGPGPWRGGRVCFRKGDCRGGLGRLPACSVRPSQSPPPPFRVPFVLHVVSLTPSLLQSLFLASCSPAPRTVAAHVAWLPGHGGWGWWAGKGGFNFGGRVEGSTPTPPQIDTSEVSTVITFPDGG